MKRLVLPILLVLLAAGCSSHAPANDATTSDESTSATPDASATPTQAPDSAAPSTAPDGAGSSSAGAASGHIHLTGDVAIDRDFPVDMCAISPPGDGLLSGYHMGAKSDDTLALLSVQVKDYSKDGTYGPADKTQQGQVAQAMTGGTMGPLTLMMMNKDSHAPLAFMLNPQSKLDITISGDGAKGDAEFSGIEAPNVGDPGHGTVVSGSVTWTCGQIGRLNPQMNNAVNGMFKKLIH